MRTEVVLRLSADASEATFALRNAEEALGDLEYTFAQGCLSAEDFREWRSRWLRGERRALSSFASYRPLEGGPNAG